MKQDLVVREFQVKWLTMLATMGSLNEALMECSQGLDGMLSKYVECMSNTSMPWEYSVGPRRAFGPYGWLCGR